MVQLKHLIRKKNTFNCNSIERPARPERSTYTSSWEIVKIETEPTWWFIDPPTIMPPVSPLSRDGGDGFEAVKGEVNVKCAEGLSVLAYLFSPDFQNFPSKER